ncbi:MAG: phospho-N-acetylmuramoyl-pentapeptide-transferase [Solobacterium sp.]|nr:phospho-N-acetylmuramoyl-pentapeptide-transferase [Solobacterium sp.]
MVVRTVMGFLISLACIFVFMPPFIRFLKKISFNQSVSEYSLEEFQMKAKTPIMGGILFIVVPVIVSLVSVPDALHDLDLIIVLITFVGYGIIGFIDDYLIAVKKNNDGLTAWAKFLLQVILAFAVFLLYREDAGLSVTLLFSRKSIHLGFFYIILILFMFSGASNAVNLTDGMDGLAAGCEVFALLPYFLFAYRQGQYSISVFVACLLGALAGYLHFNIHPAKIFMGDTGSLSLGAVLAALAMVLKKELSLIVIGGVFVLETLCVIIQIGSVKLRGKRVFPYTPIHYAFVVKGIPEEKVVRYFWVCAILFAMIGYYIAY